MGRNIEMRAILVYLGFCAKPVLLFAASGLAWILLCGLVLHLGDAYRSLRKMMGWTVHIGLKRLTELKGKFRKLK